MKNPRIIKVGKKKVEAYIFKLLKKNLIFLRGSKGYIMCGYLNLKTAEKLKDCAIKITGVTSISDALQTTVNSCTSEAKRLGIHKGQPIKDVLFIIA